MPADNAKLHIHKPEFQADAIRNLGGLVTRMQTLLATLRSSSIGPEAKPHPTPLAPTLAAWVREMATEAPPRIHLETRLGCTPEVSIDPQHFQTVLHNLVLNAVEAIPDEGTLLIETLTQDGSVVLAVSDTGRGMSPEFIQQRLFRPFQTTKPRGLGVGLYQCRQILQQFGGSLTAESKEGIGTSMIVRLPITFSPIQDPQSPMGSPPLRKGGPTVRA